MSLVMRSQRHQSNQDQKKRAVFNKCISRTVFPKGFNQLTQVNHMATFLHLGPVQFSPCAASCHHSAPPGEIWSPGCDSTGGINVGVRPCVLKQHMCLLPATLGRTGEPSSLTSLGLQSHDQMHAEDSIVQPSPISSYLWQVLWILRALRSCHLPAAT